MTAKGSKTPVATNTPGSAAPSPQMDGDKPYRLVGGIAAGVLAGAALMYFLAQHGPAELFRMAGASIQHSGADGGAAPNAPVIWQEYPNLTANLANGSGALQATVALELADESTKERLDRSKPLVMARILDQLGRVTYDRLIDPNAKVVLARDIRDSLNTLLAGEQGRTEIRQVVFPAFVFSAD
jgi:flagellar basal body-associated protein FliL